MGSTENGIHCLRQYTKFSSSLRPMRGNYLKRILTCLYYNKCNKTDVSHLDTQKHVSNKKWYKCHKYFVYRITQKFCINGGNV